MFCSCHSAIQSFRLFMTSTPNAETNSSGQPNLNRRLDLRFQMPSFECREIRCDPLACVMNDDTHLIHTAKRFLFPSLIYLKIGSSRTGDGFRWTQFQVRKHMDPHLDRWKGMAQQPIPIYDHPLLLFFTRPCSFSFCPANLAPRPNIPRRS